MIVKRNPGNLIKVSAVLRNPHPYVRQTQEALKNAKTNDYGVLYSWRTKYLDVNVSPRQLGRALRIMNALIKSLEKRNLSVTIGKGWYKDRDETFVTILGEKISFGIREPSNRKDREPTAQEKKEGRKPYPRFEYIPSGRFSLKINESAGDIRKTWTDGEKLRIENCLNEFVVGLIQVAERKKARRLEREREEKKRREWLRQREEKIKLIREEEARVNRLEKDALDWQRSQKIREYIDTVEKDDKVTKDEDFEKWVTWANQQADRLDPLAESLPSILDEKEKYCI